MNRSTSQGADLFLEGSFGASINAFLCFLSSGDVDSGLLIFSSVSVSLVAILSRLTCRVVYEGAFEPPLERVRGGPFIHTIPLRRHWFRYWAILPNLATTALRRPGCRRIDSSIVSATSRARSSACG